MIIKCTTEKRAGRGTVIFRSLSIEHPRRSVTWLGSSGRELPAWTGPGPALERQCAKDSVRHVISEAAATLHQSQRFHHTAWVRQVDVGRSLVRDRPCLRDMCLHQMDIPVAVGEQVGILMRWPVVHDAHDQCKGVTVRPPLLHRGPSQAHFVSLRVTRKASRPCSQDRTRAVPRHTPGFESDSSMVLSLRPPPDVA